MISPSAEQQIRDEWEAIQAEIREVSDATEALLRPYVKDGHVRFGDVPRDVQREYGALGCKQEALDERSMAFRCEHFPELLTLLASLSQELETAKAELNGSRLLRMEWQARAEQAEQELERIRTENQELLARSPSVGLASATGSPRSSQPEGSER